jgi:cytochrome c peroxidase
VVAVHGIHHAPLRTPDVPLYRLVNRTTGERVETTDPGRALVTGAWSDIGAFNVPILRGLAARSPCFHNGMASPLDEVVAFYHVRFRIGLSEEDKNDLVVFLRAL